MPLDLDLTDRSVLLVGDPGPRSLATVHALLRAGAVVTIETSVPSVSVRDLAERGLVNVSTQAEHAAYDVVIRATQDLGRDPVNPPSGAGEPSGHVTLLGGGPGDPGLMPAVGLQAIADADVIVHDRLAPLSLLGLARPDAEIIDVGKIPRGAFTPQERINAILVEQARRGRRVVRLKGGDPFVFGRGAEEALACREAGIQVTVVPGVSSSVAAPALAGIPVTHRDLVQGFTVVSGHVPPGDPRSTVDWAALARTGTTLVVLMGVATLPAIAETLIGHGLQSDTPAAVIADAGLPSMHTVRAPLAEIAQAARREGLGAPAVAVIGDVAALDVLA